MTFVVGRGAMYKADGVRHSTHSRSMITMCPWFVLLILVLLVLALGQRDLW